MLAFQIIINQKDSIINLNLLISLSKGFQPLNLSLLVAQCTKVTFNWHWNYYSKPAILINHYLQYSIQARIHTLHQSLYCPFIDIHFLGQFCWCYTYPYLPNYNPPPILEVSHTSLTNLNAKMLLIWYYYSLFIKIPQSLNFIKKLV